MSVQERFLFLDDNTSQRGPVAQSWSLVILALVVAGVSVLLLPAAATAAASDSDDALTVEQVVARYAAARGGERWQQVKTLKLTGTYAAFSQQAPFTLLRRHGDHYRLDHTVLGAPAVRARDAQGPWMQHALLAPEPSRTEEPYSSYLERESLFAPLLLGYPENGIELQLVGPGEVDGIPTLNLQVTLPGGAEETWYLHPDTYLEVAVDRQVPDYTQGPNPMRQRAFYDDFRTVEGLVLPFSIDWEFGARLEEMRVEEVRVNPDLPDERFTGPEPQPEESEGAVEEAGSEESDAKSEEGGSKGSEARG